MKRKIPILLSIIFLVAGTIGVVPLTREWAVTILVYIVFYSLLGS